MPSSPFWVLVFFFFQFKVSETMRAVSQPNRARFCLLLYCCCTVKWLCHVMPIQGFLIAKVARQRRDSRKHSCLILMSALRCYLDFVPSLTLQTTPGCKTEDSVMSLGCSRRVWGGAWGFKTSGDNTGNPCKLEGAVLSILPFGRGLWKEPPPEMCAGPVIENACGSTQNRGRV